MRATFAVAREVIRDALYGPAAIRIAVAMVLLLGILSWTLDLDVVEGTLATARLFGVDHAAHETVFLVLGWLLFAGILLFGILGTSGAAPSLLAPGRVELLLSLPIRRGELIVGTFLGVVTLGLLVTLIATTGLVAILFFEGGLFEPLVLAMAAGAALAFVVVYAFMLLTATLIRSAPTSGIAGLMLLFLSLLASARTDVIPAQGWGRPMYVALTAWVPKLLSLGMPGRSLAQGEAIDFSQLGYDVAGAVTFCAACLVAAALVVDRRDY